jgi:hypothetical protein
MTSTDPIEIERDLLCTCAILNPDSERLEKIANLFPKITNWERLIRQAEIDGIAPTLNYHANQSAAEVPNQVRQQLRGLSVRHRHATPTRIKEYVHIQSKLQEAGIDSAALKGIALACLIYPKPSLRPMRDIDFLVAPHHAETSMAVLKQLGYQFAETETSRYMGRHHHLPNATRKVDGLSVCVEIHTRAMSGDAPGTIRLDRLTEPLRNTETPYGAISTLGHIDMLNQLCRHALEPGKRIRLISVMDIIGYTAMFADQIDWPRLAKKYPYLPNFLGLLHFVSPLPAALKRFIPDYPPPLNCGELIATVSYELRRHKTRWSAMHSLFNPPEWWFRSYYGVAPNASSRLLGQIAHRMQVTKWFARRAIAALAPDKFRH